MVKLNFQNIVVNVERDVLRMISENKQKKLFQKETGGMLLGSINRGEEIKEMTIRDFTVPLPGDKQSRFRFRRNNKQHNRLLKNKWIESNKTIMYVGEWHTHPEIDPHYSAQDLKNWKYLLKESKTYGEYLFFIIGGTGYYKIWVGNRNTKDITELHKGEYNEIT